MSLNKTIIALAFALALTACSKQEEATDEIEIDYDGDTVEIGFNISYLIDALTNMEQEMVKIEVTDSNSSALITIPEDSNFKYVVMPMRI